jgi:hypothetical protein
MNKTNLLEKQVLVFLSSGKGFDDDDTLFDALTTGLDWDWLVKASTLHRLDALLGYQALNEKRGAGNLPQPLREYFVRRQAAHFERYLYFAKEISEILKALNSNNISPILLKGPLLALLYPQPYLRPYGDLDIFISDDDVTKVKAVLLAEGYDSIHDERPISEIRGHLGGYFKCITEAGKRKRAGEMAIEVHAPRHISIGPVGLIDVAEWLDLAQPLNLLGAKCFTLPSELELLYLCLHTHNHFSKDTRMLRLLMDTYRVIQKGIAWPTFLTQVKRYQRASDKAAEWIRAELSKRGGHSDAEWFTATGIADQVHFTLSGINECYGPVVPAPILEATIPEDDKSLKVLASGSDGNAYLWSIPQWNRVLDFPDTREIIPQLLDRKILSRWLKIPAFPLWADNDEARNRWKCAPRFMPE